MAVKVVKVDSPMIFWVQLKTGNENFQNLLEELSRKMIQKRHMLRHRPDFVVVGEIMAIRENREWQRGIITDINGNGTVAIFLRDWGRNVKRQLFEVHILEDRFCWQEFPVEWLTSLPFPVHLGQGSQGT